MSFGKLLAAGKSFVGGHDGSRYRVRPGVVLPKFISPKNPFSQPLNKDAPARTVSPRTHAENLSQKAADAGARAALSSQFSKDAARVSVWRKIWRWAVEGSRKLGLFKRRSRQSEIAMPHLGSEPVQGELSLDRVRVVRNDLSDADLEVVPVGEAGSSERTPKMENAWGRLATRIFETENNVI